MTNKTHIVSVRLTETEYNALCMVQHAQEDKNLGVTLRGSLDVFLAEAVKAYLKREARKAKKEAASVQP
jgi:anti-sigma factor RsiW